MITAKAAKDIVDDEIARRKREFRSLRPRWRSIAQLSSGKNEGPIAATERHLRELDILYDVDRLQLQSSVMERWINARCPVPDQHRSKIADLLELDELSPLCFGLEKAATICPDPIRLALGGNIAAAVRSIPADGKDDHSAADFLAFILSIARYHLLYSLISAATDAQLKLFEPTGLHIVDGTPGTHAALYKQSGMNVLAEEARLQPLVAIYPALSHSPITQKAIASLNAEPRAVQDALALQRQLESRFGPLGTPCVDNLYAAAKDIVDWQTAMIKAEVGKARPNQTFYKVHGTTPLPILFLTCAAAISWVSHTSEEVSALEQALYSLRKREPITKPDVKRTSRNSEPVSEQSRRLFFLMRNLFVRDPKAVLPSETDMKKISQATENLWQVEDVKDKRLEPFSSRITGQAKIALNMANNSDDAIFLSEINGPLWVQLRLV